MKKRIAKEMDFEEFKNKITLEMSNELANKNISYNKAYAIFQDLLRESSHNDDSDIGTMESIVQNIILDYMDELLAMEYDKYETDWEL